jgi:hypothetical protein
MKRRNGLIVFTIAGLMAVLLCLPGSVVAGGNPIVPEADEKLIGPNTQATVIIGWRPDPSNDSKGIVTGFIRVNDLLYVVEEPGSAQAFIHLFDPDLTDGEDEFNIPWGLVNLSDRLPQQIAIDLGLGEDALPTVFVEKDVSDYQLRCFESVGCPPEGDVYIPNYGVGVGPDVFKLAVHATAKLSFVVPKSGKP